MRWLTAIAVSLAATALAAVDEGRVAIVIGANHGVGEDLPLEYAESDAVRFQRLLVEVGLVAADRAQLVLAPGADGVRRALAIAKGQLEARAASGPTSIIVYVSSHADAEALHLGGTLLPVAELRRLVDALPAALRLVVVDACRTPARVKGGRAVSEEVPVARLVEGDVRGSLFLSSAAPGEAAQEWSILRGSLFTHHLIGALRGLADADGDGAVSLAEAWSHAARSTLARSVRGDVGEQHPSFEADLRGWGEWSFSRPSALASRIVLAEGVEGRLWVADERDELVAEVSKPKGARLSLAVRPGRYRLVSPRDRHADVADVTVPAGDRVVDEAAFVKVGLEAARRRGSEAVVLRPWALGLSVNAARGLVEGAGVTAVSTLSIAWLGRTTWARARIGYAHAGFDTEAAAVAQHEVHGAIGGGLAWTWWPLELHLGLDARAAWVRQQLTRIDGSQASGVFGEEPPRSDLVVGSAVTLGLAWHVADRWRLQTELTAGGWRVPKWDGRAELRGALSAGVGVAWAY